MRQHLLRRGSCGLRFLEILVPAGRWPCLPVGGRAQLGRALRQYVSIMPVVVERRTVSSSAERYRLDVISQRALEIALQHEKHCRAIAAPSPRRARGNLRAASVSAVQPRMRRSRSFCWLQSATSSARTVPATRQNSRARAQRCARFGPRTAHGSTAPPPAASASPAMRAPSSEAPPPGMPCRSTARHSGADRRRCDSGRSDRHRRSNAPRRCIR